MTVEVTQARPATDRGPKRLGYAAAAIPLYLLVDRDEGTVTLHSEPRDGDRQLKRVPISRPLAPPEPFAFTLDTGEFG